MAAAAAAGLVEAAVHGASPVSAVCAAGAAAIYAAPLGFLLSLAARGLWRAWRPVLAGMDGAALTAGAVYAAMALAALGAAGYGAALLSVIGRGPEARLDPAPVAALLGLAAAALLAASRPAVSGLARAARAIGLRRRRSGAIAVGVLAGILAAAIWFGVVGPAMSRIDYGYDAYGWSFVVALVAGHAAARRMRSRRAVAGAAAALICLALIGGAIATRLRDPAALFDAWYRMPVGGLAIGFTHDIDDLRSQSMPADPTPRARPGAPHPDIVLVTIDTVRADQLRLYGGAAGTPNLEDLARRGVVFDWALAPSNNTRQSVSSMMTGLSPARLRGRVVEFGLKLDPRHILVAERFRAAGYTTAGFLCCVNHMGGRRKIGLDRGLETVAFERSGSRLTDLATDWLRASAGEPRPRFVWVHIFDPHDWKWQFPGGEEEAESRYREAVQRADRFLAPIVSAVDGSARPAFLVVASDHGEGLGDHRALHHASNLYNSQIRVPLVIAGPGVAAARRVAAPVGLLDLAPTLLDLAGFEPPALPAMDARSFAPLARSEAPAPGDVYAVMVRDRSVQRSGRAVVAGRYKLILIDGKKPELYDLAADPGEKRNVARHRAAVLSDMTEKLERRRATDGVEPF